MVEVTSIRHATGRLIPAGLGASDLLRLGGSGLRSRPLRVVLSALGIAIGIAAMVAVVGISSSSQANLDRALAAMGTNMLSVSPGQTMFGHAATLPDDALEMIERIAPVTAASAVGTVRNKPIYRTDHNRVVGVLNSVPLASELDSAVLIGWSAAMSYLDFDGHATTIYTRSVESQVESVRSILAATANPESPDQVNVAARLAPTEALAAT
jgi:ABC-type antimicrobial peptide transport system permease subunit